MHDERALHDVVELANIARPVIRLQRGTRGRADHGHRAICALRRAAQQKACEWHNIQTPFAQGRYLQRKHVQAVVEILTEAARTNLALEIAIRGGDDSHIEIDQRIAANPLNLPLL